MLKLKVVLLFVLAFSFNSCEEEVEPIQCADGCSGADCNIKISTKYVGTWNGEFTCNDGMEFQGILILTEKSNCRQVQGSLADGFSNFDLVGTANGNNTIMFDVDQSNLSASANFRADGSLEFSTVSNNRICNANLTK